MDFSETELGERQTGHGLLVAFGEFCKATGWMDGLQSVRIPQKVQSKVGAVTPQSKLIELSAGILAGIEYLQDLSLGAQPIAKDRAVADAWSQARFVHASNVSRTLAACDATTLSDLQAVIDRFNRPFIAEALHEEIRCGREITLDVDLTGQPVSSTSRTYPEAAFGFMNQEVRLGYQLARVCVQTARYGRIWLAGFHHPGDTVSVNCLKELVLAAEAQAGLRPRRRSELVDHRLASLGATRQHWEDRCRQTTTRLTTLATQRDRLLGRRYHLEQLARQATQPSRKAYISRLIATTGRQLPRLEQRRVTGQALATRQRARVQQIDTEYMEGQAWQAQLVADNAQVPNAPICVCRSDAGFCSGENLAWLIEMGYQVETKSSSGKLTEALKTRCTDKTSWTEVGKNAQMIDWTEYVLYRCAYPVRVGLERFATGHPRTKYSVLITYRDDPAPRPTVPDWFNHYNDRQVIEAGNKQMKTVFHVQHLVSHAKTGIQIQVMLTGWACNVTQFIQPWLQAAAEPFTTSVKADLSSPKTMVRVLANTPASVQQTPWSTIVVFDAASSRPGLKLCLHGYPLHQLNLGLFQPSQISSDSLILPVVAQPLR